MASNHSSSFTYHGIAISAAEIRFARQQAQLHLRDQPLYQRHEAVTFRQQSFDQSFVTTGNHPSNYTVAVAIESLSHSRNLEKTVVNIVDALEPGGLLIVVDDVVLPQQKQHHPVGSVDDHHNHPTMVRPSLLPHTAWLAAMEAAHCRVIEQRDLSLQYELALSTTTTATTTHPDDTMMTTTTTLLGQSPPPLPLQHTDTLLAWGLVPLSVLPWEVFWGDATSHRLLELHEERGKLRRLAQQRQRGVERAELAYHWYVCVKE